MGKPNIVRRFWTAVAERSGDTAFRLRNALLNAGAVNDSLRALANIIHRQGKALAGKS